MEVINVIARDPLPDDLPFPGDLYDPVVFEHRIGSHFRLNTVCMRQDQRVTARGTGSCLRRVVASREIRTLPVVMLAQGPDRLCFFCLGFLRLAIPSFDLLVMVETPQHFAVEIALNEFE